MGKLAAKKSKKVDVAPGPDPLSLPKTFFLFGLTISVVYVWLCGWPIDPVLVPGKRTRIGRVFHRYPQYCF